MNPAFLSDREKTEVLAWFLHYMEMPERGRLMATYPEAYNKMAGREIVRVVRAETAERFSVLPIRFES